MRAIAFDRKKKIFSLASGDSFYSFGINREGALYHIYYGAKEGKKTAPRFSWFGYHDSDRRQNMLPEAEIYDGRNVFENTLKVSFPGNLRIAQCVYSGHIIKDNSLEVVMSDKKRGFSAILRYLVRGKYGLIEKSIIIKNTARRGGAVVENCYSGSLVLPPGNYDLGYLSGAWAKEAYLTVEKLNPGKKVIESRTGNSSHLFNPSFFITPAGAASEITGDVYFGQLLWSGNFKFTFEKRFHGAVAAHCGINDFDSRIILKPGEEFTTPAFLFGFVDSGLGAMSRALHDYYREEVMPAENRNKTTPVPANSWEGFYFGINEKSVRRLAEKAAEAGAEALIIDDGWFGKRNDDKTSLGDWEPDGAKFPSGMKSISKYIKSLGLKFGIWIEPEMVSPKSILYRKHPEWAYGFKGIKSSLMRNQLVLNITKPAVMEFIKKLLKKITLDYGADFIKWDMNRYISEAGADNLEYGKPAWIEHARKFYELMGALRKLKPGIVIEGCAGGGGRFDGEMLKYADCIWTSDNTDALDRQFIQYGISLFYPARAMDSHVSDVPNWFTKRSIPLSFRLATAMAGNFGIQANILKWKSGEFRELKESIIKYKRIRDIIFFGDLHRLSSPYTSKTPAVMYVSKDSSRGVIFAYNTGKKCDALFYPEALKNELKYRVSGGKKETISAGSVIMKKGIKVGFNGVYDSSIIEFTAVK
ncbi:MAG: alpha-galactosidase [Candidatus Goldiibacteriota bacterium]|jgi:alpha-galactosidase